MTKVSLRAFQLKPKLYLDKLPIELTRYGKVIAYLDLPNNQENILINTPVNEVVITKGPVQKKTVVAVEEKLVTEKPKKFNAMLNE